MKQNVIARLRQSAKIANNPAYDSNCTRNADTRILAAFRKLLVVSSAVTSDLRLKAFDEETLQRLDDNLKSQVGSLPPQLLAWEGRSMHAVRVRHVRGETSHALSMQRLPREEVLAYRFLERCNK